MKLTNIERLKTLIKDSIHHPVREGYVCIGYGSNNNSLRNVYGIEPQGIYAWAYEGYMDNGYNGSDSKRVYYITENLYNNHVLRSLSNSIEQAIALKGKTVSYIDGHGKEHVFVVDTWDVVQHQTLEGINTNKVIDADGYSVNVHFDNHRFSAPVCILTVVETATLKITEDYEAVISKGKVQVGCQTIDIETVRKIIELHDKL